MGDRTCESQTNSSEQSASRASVGNAPLVASTGNREEFTTASASVPFASSVKRGRSMIPSLGRSLSRSLSPASASQSSRPVTPRSPGRYESIDRSELDRQEQELLELGWEENGEDQVEHV